MRVTTASNRMSAIPGASMVGVEFTREGLVVGIRHRARRLTCPWRHLSLGACRPFLEAEIRRLDCRACGRVRTETVPWARPGSRLTRDLEDVVAWLAKRLDKTSVAKFLRVAWETVAAIVVRVVAEHLDPGRLERLYRIGVDEVSDRKGHRYLTVVADPDLRPDQVTRASAREVVWRCELGHEWTAAVYSECRESHRDKTGGGAPGRIRTADAHLRTVPLYPLSYGGAGTQS
jgi:hypothetical protein